MAAQTGRDVLIKMRVAGSFVTIGGLRTKSLKINEGTVDVTDSVSPGRFRELLAAGGILSMSISGGGVYKDSAAEAAIVSNKLAGVHPEMQFIVPNLGTFEGTFMIGDIDLSAGHDNETSYSFSFESAAEISFTAS